MFKKVLLSFGVLILLAGCGEEKPQNQPSVKKEEKPSTIIVNHLPRL